MILPLQWDEFHVKVWSWLKDKSFQGHVQFEVECDFVQYENKVEIIDGIYSLNLLGENNPKGVKNHHRKNTY